MDSQASTATDSHAAAATDSQASAATDSHVVAVRESHVAAATDSQASAATTDSQASAATDSHAATANDSQAHTAVDSQAATTTAREVWQETPGVPATNHCSSQQSLAGGKPDDSPIPFHIAPTFIFSFFNLPFSLLFLPFLPVSCKQELPQHPFSPGILELSLTNSPETAG
jgi:hypothetical protein